jgi:hypothetical protein
MYELFLTFVIIVIIYVLLENLFTTVTDVRKCIIFNGERFHQGYTKIKEMVNRQEK